MAQGVCCDPPVLGFWDSVLFWDSTSPCWVNLSNTASGDEGLGKRATQEAQRARDSGSTGCTPRGGSVRATMSQKFTCRDRRDSEERTKGKRDQTERSEKALLPGLSPKYLRGGNQAPGARASRHDKGQVTSPRTCCHPATVWNKSCYMIKDIKEEIKDYGLPWRSSG